MHNDVKQCFRGSNFHCGSCISNESTMASYFPEVGNLNGSNADICSDVAGPSSSGSGNLFELPDWSNETIILLFSPLHFGFEHNSHTAFGTCYVITHKVYYVHYRSRARNAGDSISVKYQVEFGSIKYDFGHWKYGRSLQWGKSASCTFYYPSYFEP